MDTEQKNVKDTLIKFFVSTFFIIIIMIFINNIIDKIYNEYNSDEAVAVFNSNLSNEEVVNQDTFEREVAENILSNINIMVNGYAIQFNDEVVGYVLSENQRNEILHEIALSYVNELNLNLDDVVKINFTGNLEAMPDSTNLCNLSSANEIATKIYEIMTIDNQIDEFQVEVMCRDIEDFNRETVVEESNDLYMGQTSETEGIGGKKAVYKEMVYSGFDKVEEDVVTEVIIEDAVPAVVQVGVKNPIGNNVEFLNSPVDGAVVTSYFGEQRQGYAHKGLDLAIDLGTEVSAAFEGQVLFAGYNSGGYGNLIILQHDNGITTYYGHLNDIYVAEGDYVQCDDIIGTVGSTGNSTGPHLHFEVRQNDSLVNPLNYIIGW